MENIKIVLRLLSHFSQILALDFDRASALDFANLPPRASNKILNKSRLGSTMHPIQTVHVKLMASDLLSLTAWPSNPPCFTRKGRTISRAETVGMVVSREHKDKFLRFLVDDGSGCIPCILWLNHRYLTSHGGSSNLDLMAEMMLKQSEIVQLGELVRVRGRITIYRGMLQITVRDVVVERDPNAEVLHWLDCIRLAKECYDLLPAVTLPGSVLNPPQDRSDQKNLRVSKEWVGNQWVNIVAKPDILSAISSVSHGAKLTSCSNIPKRAESVCSAMSDQDVITTQANSNEEDKQAETGLNDKTDGNMKRVNSRKRLRDGSSEEDS